jgi:hypothetical protein
MDFKDDYQQREDVVSVHQEQQTQQNSYVEDQSQQGVDEAAWAARIQDGEQETHHHHGRERRDRTVPNERELSARLRGDNELTSIFEGVGTIKKGDRGVDVTKLQQALVDMKYQLPVYGVDGKFEDETLAALELFQADAGLTVSGELDSETIQAMDARFDERTDYLTAADEFDEEAPREDTRELSEEDQTAALATLNPQSSAAGAIFDVQDSDAYSTEIRQMLTNIIAEFHQKTYADLAPLRADPETNFHEDGDIEGAANAGKEVTDQLYGNLNTGPAFQMNVNLIDQWKDQEDRQELLNDVQKKRQAISLVEYLIDANCGAVHHKYNANPSGSEESKALRPIIDSLVDSEEKIQILLDIDTGWKGAQQDGIQYLQRYKDPNNEANREKMWELFHVSIHEYIHTLAHSEYRRWAYGLGGSETHTLIEGFCEFFTLNVRAKFPTSALVPFQQQVEGSFYDATTPQAIPDVDALPVGVYNSNAEAERMVGIIGIKNAQLGYFQGAVDLMGR